MKARIFKEVKQGAFVIEGFVSDITDRKLAETGEQGLEAFKDYSSIDLIFMGIDRLLHCWNRDKAEIKKYSGRLPFANFLKKARVKAEIENIPVNYQLLNQTPSKSSVFSHNGYVPFIPFP